GTTEATTDAEMEEAEGVVPFGEVEQEFLRSFESGSQAAPVVAPVEPAAPVQEQGNTDPVAEAPATTQEN
ncbi:hypothetical protein ABTN02_19440, partial [Acinetobacter baumannii]